MTRKLPLFPASVVGSMPRPLHDQHQAVDEPEGGEQERALAGRQTVDPDVAVEPWVREFEMEA